MIFCWVTDVLPVRGSISPGKIHSLAVFELATVEADPDAASEKPVLPDGEHDAAEPSGVTGRGKAGNHQVQQAFHADVFKPRSLRDGESLSLAAQGIKPGENLAVVKIARFQIFFGQFVVPGADPVDDGVSVPDMDRLGAKAPDLFEDAGRVGGFAIRFADKKDHRNSLLPQGAPQRHRLGTDALAGANQENRAVHGPQTVLHLGGEIRVAGGIYQVDHAALPAYPYGCRPNGYAPPLFHGQGIGMGGAAVHAAGFPDGAGEREQLFRQGGLACVHIREDADVAYVHGFLPFAAPPKDTRRR